MVTQLHWLAEGDGPDLVVMCVPPTVAASGNPPPPMPDPPDPGYPGYP